MKDDKFNFTHVALTERGIEIGGTRGPRRIGNVPESLDHFRTIAFGIEIMRDTIEAARETSSVEAGRWFHGIVPACYRPAVEVALGRAFGPYRGRKLLPETVLAFIDDLNREIWATVAPIMPGEDVEFDASAWSASVQALAPDASDQEERDEQQRSPRDIAHAWFMLGSRCGWSADGEQLQDLFTGSWEEYGEEGPDE